MQIATRNPNFASPVEFNFFGYRVVDNNTHKTADNVTASFKYRGYEIAMTTHDPSGAKVIVLLNKVLVEETGTVEAAIAAVDELMNWQGANRVARAAAMRHAGGWRRS